MAEALLCNQQSKSEGLTYKIIKDDFIGIENAIGYERIRGANSE